jgi:hypothetical protein
MFSGLLLAKPKLRWLLLVAALAMVSLVPTHAEDAEATAVKAALLKEFDRPEARLDIAPVVTVGMVAIAGWRQQGRGGRALLRLKTSGWAIVLCAGDALRKEESLSRMGISANVSAELARLLAIEEAKLPRDHIVLLDSFEGELVIEGAGHPAPANGHGHGPGQAAKP